MVLEDDLECSMCGKVICHSLVVNKDFFVYHETDGVLVFCVPCEIKYNIPRT